jgi:hypothetical protein
VRGHHQGIGTQILIQTEVVVKKQVEKVSIVVRLALSEKKGGYHCSAVGLHDVESMLAIALGCSTIAMRISAYWCWRFRHLLNRRCVEDGRRWQFGRPLRTAGVGGHDGWRPLRSIGLRPLRSIWLLRRRPLERHFVVVWGRDVRVVNRSASILRALHLLLALAMRQLDGG